MDFPCFAFDFQSPRQQYGTYPVSGDRSDPMSQVGVSVVSSVSGNSRITGDRLSGGGGARVPGGDRRVRGRRGVARLLGSRQRCF